MCRGEFISCSKLERLQFGDLFIEPTPKLYSPQFILKELGVDRELLLWEPFGIFGLQGEMDISASVGGVCLQLRKVVLDQI